MIHLRKVVSSLAILAVCAAPSLAQSISSQSIDEGTTGSVITITGSGFGTAKPKVELIDRETGKKAKGTNWKVTENSDTSITAELRKAKAGDYDLQVRPKGKGITPALSKEGFTVRGISNIVADVMAGDPGEEVTVSAEFMGLQKGRAKIGGKKAKITSWEPNGGGSEGTGGIFTIKLPKKIANGVYEIEVKNKTYIVTSDDFIEIENSDFGIPKDGKAKFTAKLGGSNFKATPQTLLYTSLPVGKNVVTSFSPVAAGLPPKAWQFSFLYDANAGGNATISGSDILAITYSEGLPPNTLNYTGHEGITINITGVTAGGQLTGNLSGTLTRVNGTGPDTLQVTNGQFSIDKAPNQP